MGGVGGWVVGGGWVQEVRVVCVLQVMSQMSGHREEMERSLQKVKMALEDTHQENTELISKVHTLLGGHQIGWQVVAVCTFQLLLCLGM